MKLRPLILILFLLTTASSQAAIELDGADDYIHITDLGLSSGTFCTWLQTSDINAGDENRLFSQTSGATTQGGALGVGISGTGTGSLSVWDGGAWNRITNFNAISAATWTHACVRYQGSGGATRAFINGVAESIVANSDFDFSGVDLALGGDFLLTHGNKWDGKLEDSRIYNRLLSNGEVLAIYNSRSKRATGLLANGLIAHYEMDDAAIGEVVTMAKDDSGNDYHGEFIGFTNLTTALTNDVANNIGTGQSLSFDGVDDYIDSPDNTTSSVLGVLSYADTDDFSLSLWYKGTHAGCGLSNTTEAILGRDSGGIYANFGLCNNKASYAHYDGSWQRIDSTTNVNDDVWHHIVYVNHSNETGDLYVDDVQEQTAAASSINLTRYFTIDNLMRGYSGRYTQGSLDNVHVYDKALSSSEVTYLYNGSGMNPGTSNLQALWTFDEDSALKDSSGNDNHGLGYGGNSLQYTDSPINRH